MTSRIVIGVFFSVASATIMAFIVYLFFKPYPLIVSENSCISRLASLETSKEFSEGCIALAESLARKDATAKDAHMIHVGGLYCVFNLDCPDRAKALFTKAIELGYPESETEILHLFEGNPGKYCPDMDKIIQRLANATDIQKTYKKIWTDSWARQGCGSLQPATTVTGA